MARHYSTQEALDIIMHSDCEDGSSSSSVDSEADTEEASESMEDASEKSLQHLLQMWEIHMQGPQSVHLQPLLDLSWTLTARHTVFIQCSSL
ncbi:hypothetical protein F7725_026620 [Dissostichus mawsoni]|uniref:Uncharacterized protein n=1 Tax=Dissostichus mawsoni TaxID=36200 RepID=A0A7J5X7L6_DISMA|nr:hypothetical protein F7725_026620 [Dissostichus mawsoni]